MFGRALSIAMCALVFLAAPSLAQQGILDLVPAEPTLGAIAIQNVDELIKKGDKFLQDTNFNIPIRPSELFRQAVQFLGIQGGIDERGSLGIILLRPDRDGDEMGFRDLEELILAALPVGDLDKLAGSFGFGAGELKPGRVTLCRRERQFVRYVYVRDKHLYLSNSKRSLERVAASKPLSTELDGDLRKSLQRSDILLHFAPKGIFREWKSILADLEKELPKVDDPVEQKAVQQLLEAMASIRFASGGIRIDDGLGMTMAAVFPKEGAAPELLASLRSGQRAADLTALPEGNLLVAQANAGEGAKTLLLARAVIGFLFKNILESRQIISATDRPNFVGVFSEVWQRLQGSRLGVYLTGDETKRGLFSVVAILDADDAKKFLTDMKVLARIADGSVLDLEKKPKAEEIDIGKLIGDLGSKTYRVREGAGTRLRLLGEPAVPYLEKAMKDGKDLEVVRRAERIWGQINVAAAQRRKELLAKDLPAFIRPSFAFVPRAEQRAGYAVDVIKIKLAEKEGVFEKHMQDLLGPQWDQMRLAVHENQIVVLLGSEVELFEAALTNVREKRPGLAGSKTLAAFNRQANATRLAELHVSVQSLLALTNPQRTPVVSGPLSSFALGVEPTRLQLDLFLPTAEVRRVMKERPF